MGYLRETRGGAAAEPAAGPGESLESRRLLSGISVIPVPTANVLPTDIAVGADGNLWFTESNGDSIGKVNPTTHVVTEIPLPSSVGIEGADQVSITAGPDGNLWFADYDGNTIGSINPTTDAITVFRVPTPNAGLMDITTGPDGNLWFTEKAANQIGTINPKTDAITEFPVPTANSWLVDITAGLDGNLWFTEQVGNAIGTINPTTGAITEYPLPTPDSSLSGITAGPDGNLWFTETGSTEAGSIGTINPTTHAITEFPLPAGPPGTISVNGVITTGPDGNLWFGYFNGDDVGTINPTTDAITVYPVPLANPDLRSIGGPAAIAVGPDGNMWITLENANEIGVFNPQTLSVAPAEPPPTINPTPPQPPIVAVPPIEPITPTTPTAPATPGMSFGFTVTLEADTVSSGTATLAFVNDPGSTTLTVTTQDGIDTFSWLTLKKLGNGPGYKVIAGNQTATPEGLAAVASTRPLRLATEKVLTAGKGKDKQVVGFKIDLGKALDPTGPGCRAPDRDPDRPASQGDPRAAGQPPGRLQLRSRQRQPDARRQGQDRPRRSDRRRRQIVGPYHRKPRITNKRK